MIQNYKVTAQLFWSAERVETVAIKCHTSKTAEKRAEEYFKKKYPNIGSMIKILKVETI